MEKIVRTGAPARRILVVAAWRVEDRALRAMVTRLKELIPCNFVILNLESPTTVRYRDSSRALYGRIRRYDAAVFALTARDGVSSPVLQLPGERLPVARRLQKRVPAGYLVDGPVSEAVEKAVDEHAQAWRLLPVGIAQDDKEKGGAGVENLAAALERALQ